MIYGNRFFDISQNAIDVIISTDKNAPAFSYNTLDNLTHTHVDLDFEEPVVIKQESSDGLFSPIKSLGCTISIKTPTAMFDLYHADRQSVSVKIIKHLASTEPLSEVEEIAESPSYEGGVQPNSSSEVINDDYDDTIVFGERNETHHITYPSDWVITNYAYDPADYNIDSTTNNITVLRADPGGITIYYYLESDTTSTTTTTSTIAPPTPTTTPAYEWDNPTYAYNLDIDASAVENAARVKRYNGTACITDELFLLDNTVNQVLFMGYTSPAIYDQPYDIYDTLELECVDCLSSLQYVDVDLEKDATKSWIEILGTAVQKMGGYKAFMLPTSYDKGEQCKDNIYQATNNFYDDDDEKTPWKWYDVIKEFCTTFSLSAIPYGQWIVFLDYYNLTNEYDTYSNGTGYVGRYGYTYLFEELGTLATDIPYAGRGGSLQLSPCYNKIEISDSLYEQDTKADIDEQMDEKFYIKSNCSPDYHSNLPYSGQYPQDMGYTYWRSFCYSHHDTVMLYRFIKPDTNNITIGPAIHWAVDKTESIWRIYKQYESPWNTISGNSFTFVDLDIDMWKSYKDTQNVPISQGTLPREYYYGHEFCWPLKYDCYDWDSDAGDYNTPSTISWKNCFLMRTLWTGEADSSRLKAGIVKRAFPMLYTTEISTGNVTWADDDIFVISGSIGRSQTPYVRTDEESSSTDNVNVMIYITGSDGRYYYLTKGLINDHEAYEWTVSNIKKDFSHSVFEAQVPYLIPIELENDDDLKGDAFVNFKDDVDFGYKLTESASGYVVPITNRLPIREGEIHVVPMGNFNTCRIYTTPVGQYTFWKDLNIQVISRNENETYDKSKDTDVVYTNTVDTSYVSDFDAVQLKINTQQETKQASYSSILNMFGNHISYDTKFYYNDGNTQYMIEEILGNKLYAYYSVPNVIYTAEIEGSLIVPFATIHENTMNKDMMVDAQELNVRSKVNTVTMCEVNKNIVSQVFTIYNRNKIGRNKYEQ